MRSHAGGGVPAQCGLMPGEGSCIVRSHAGGGVPAQ